MDEGNEVKDGKRRGMSDDEDEDEDENDEIYIKERMRR